MNHNPLTGLTSASIWAYSSSVDSLNQNATKFVMRMLMNGETK